ncbi:MAG: peptidase S58 family protein [Actinobacteria bacterium]|nr:MAG: peptidase S58 family protein [Actinomycetota bacterium]
MAFRIDGVKVGHAQDEAGLTGCSVVLLPPGAKGGVDVRGGAPGTRETDLLNPVNLVEEVHAFVLSGGSAFGLASTIGVVRYLEEHGIGFETGVARVPIVPAGVIFDLGVGDSTARPDAEMGYRACLEATEEITRQGNLGAGMGASVGMMLGPANCTKSGIGCAWFEAGGVKVFALVVVNAFGDVVDERGEVIAGARLAEGGFACTEKCIGNMLNVAGEPPPLTNTTLGVIVTNARLSKTDVNWVAQRGHNGFARAITPCHTKLDGDLIFAAATGQVEAPADAIGVVGAVIMSQAVRNAVMHAASVAGIPAYADLV